MENLKNFDPSQAASSDSGIFGLPFTEKQSRLVLLPVPWEVTTSYGRGTSLGPKIIRQASEQVDLFDIETKKAYEKGIFMLPFDEELYQKNLKLKAKAQEVVQMRMDQVNDPKKEKALLDEVNEGSRQLTAWVKQESLKVLKQGQLLGLIGGDHSSPLGAIQAISEFHGNDFGILHIDAHADLRNAYQGFEQSHASIMNNVMNDKLAPKKLVQVGIRDFCEEEFDFIAKNTGRIKTFFDLDLKKRLIRSESWHILASEIVKELPNKVYISFDIDGLDPALCPNTGTPVAGGLSLDQVYYLFLMIAESGRKIIGFDLNEVSPGDAGESEWDGNVGARVLYKLCGWSIVTNQ